MRSWPAGIMVAALAALSSIWVLEIPFALDDLNQIPMAEELLRHEVGIGADGAQKIHASYKHRFRPALWASFIAERELCGIPISPGFFHGTTLLLHVLTACLVFSLLRRPLGLAGALFGGVFFAVHPAGAQALTWLAARGDVLVALCGTASACCILKGRDTSSRAWMICGSLMLAGALMSKITGYLVIPPVLLLVWLGTGALGRRSLACLVFALPVLAVAVWRQCYLGAWLPSRPAGQEVGMEILPRYAGHLPGVLEYMLAPWNLSPGMAAQEPLVAGALAPLGEDPRLALALIIGAVLLAAFVHGRWWGAVRLMPGLLVLGLLSIPALIIFDPGSANTMGRTFYPMMVPLSFIMGAAFAGLLRKERRCIIGASVFAVVVLLVSVDAQVNTARTTLTGAELTRERLAAVEESFAELGGKGTVIIVGPGPFWQGTIQMGWMMPHAFKPPFRAEALRLLHFPAMSDLLDSGVLTREPGLFVVIEWLDDGMQIRTGPLVSIPALIRSLVAREAGGWSLSGPLPPRAVGAVRLRAPAGPELNLILRLRTDDTFLDLKHTFAASETQPRSVLLAIPPDAAWLLSSRIESIEYLEGGEGDVALPAPQLLREIPTVALQGPESDATWEATHPGSFRWSPFPGAGAWQLQFRLMFEKHAVVAMTYAFTGERIQVAADGSLTYIPDNRDFLKSNPPDTRLEHLGNFFNTFARPLDVTTLELHWRLEARSAPEGGILGRSPWRDLNIRFE